MSHFPRLGSRRVAVPLIALAAMTVWCVPATAISQPASVTDTLAEARRLRDAASLHAAARLLRPYVAAHPADAEAAALLGTLAYWEGDYSRARRLFSAALAMDSSHAEASRNLREILVLTAPWVRASGDIQHDTQPLDRLSAEARGGWFATPLISVIVGAQMRDYQDTSGAVRAIVAGDLALSAYIPALRLETEAAAGALQRLDSVMDWTGRGMVGFRITPRLVWRMRAERSAYLYTVASLGTPIMTRTVSATLDWSRRGGWLGQVAAQRAGFPDGNAVTGAHAWLLAPVVRGEKGMLQLGYSIAAQTSRETRFVADGGAVTPRDGDAVSGRFDPYHTPVNLLAHSLVASAVTRLLPRVALRANGAFGVSAHDEVLVYRTSGFPRPGAPTMAYEQRAFRPWNVRGSLEAGITTQTRLIAELDFSRTAFYGVGTARLGVTQWFRTPALRRLEQR